MRNRLLAAFLVVSAYSTVVAASDEEVTKELTERYRGQIFILRHSFQTDYQTYDDAGNLQSAFPEGPWTVYGRIVVKDIVLGSDELQIEGQRVVYEFDKKQKRLKPIADREDVHIGIRLKSRPTSSREGESLLAKVFATSVEDVLNTVPAYWRHYLSGQEHSSPRHQPSAEQNVGTTSNSQPEAKEPLSDTGQKIVHLGDRGVTAPKPKFTPEPQFTQLARKAGFEGIVTLDVVVDETGKVSDVDIIKPLGLGLDENAVQTVRTWRFVPAQMNGKPGKCKFFVEIDFHLYDKVP